MECCESGFKDTVVFGIHNLVHSTVQMEDADKVDNFKVHMVILKWNYFPGLVTQEDVEFKVLFGYSASRRPGCNTRKHVSQRKKEKKKERDRGREGGRKRGFTQFPNC